MRVLVCIINSRGWEICSISGTRRYRPQEVQHQQEHPAGSSGPWDTRSTVDYHVHLRPSILSSRPTETSQWIHPATRDIYRAPLQRENEKLISRFDASPVLPVTYYNSRDCYAFIDRSYSPCLLKLFSLETSETRWDRAKVEKERETERGYTESVG